MKLATCGGWLRRRALLFCALLLCALLLPAFAGADSTGVLSGEELNTWLAQLLRDSAEERPMNAPVGEESLTEDGYAFLYSFATLYYNKPVLDENSVLQAVALTDDGYPSVRGIRIGDDAAVLVNSFGWQNPMLLGNGSFAAFYRLDDLPAAAYWCWAIQENGALLSVRCAAHLRAEDGRYTDAGIVYHVENGKVSGARVYGLNALIDESDVRSNLAAVQQAEAAISGDEHTHGASDAIYAKNDQEPFRLNDLLFGGVNYLNFDESTARRLFGPALEESRVKDEAGAVLYSTRRDGLTLSYTESADGAVAALDTLSVTGSLQGPRGIRTGMSMEEALALFAIDGAGNGINGAAILYGDGVNAPAGLLEPLEGGATVRYLLSAQTVNGPLWVTLRMTFADGLMSEWMLYSW